MTLGNAPHRPSQREAALDHALDLLRVGGALSLESAARAAGLSKPGLMYHFPTKEALITAMVDHLVDGYERELFALLPEPSVSTPTTAERLTAYLRWALTSTHDAADLVILSDPKLRDRMIVRWTDRLRAWIEVPADLPAEHRARLHALRFIADGCWFADASNVLPLPAADRPALLAIALELLNGIDS
ncbi:TetR/AcrR family transcriptional regulator [Cryptosporangium minutisporangium]|uniref:TetR/AcrR family transcriptional regulator n=1 Tax=Cryptosporangium minutisporangium TaxID=113569 RepID=A0ABP6SZM7_9ACTN